MSHSVFVWIGRLLLPVLTIASIGYVIYAAWPVSIITITLVSTVGGLIAWFVWGWRQDLEGE